MSDEPPEGHKALLARVAMYAAALAAGVVLVLSGKTTPTEASVFVSPFLLYTKMDAPVSIPRAGRRNNSDRQ